MQDTSKFGSLLELTNLPIEAKIDIVTLQP